MLSNPGSARVEDINGWIEIKGNPISKVGVYPYLGSQIGAPIPDQIYYVYRPEEELAHPSTIDSFKLLPWTNEHAMLGRGFMAAEQKGVHGVIGEDVYFDYPYLRANIKIWSESLASDVDNGKIELSPGYRCEYVPEVGLFEGQRYEYVQRGIRGNHLALVDQGRTGPDVAVLDHFKVTLDTGEFMPKPVLDQEDPDKENPTLPPSESPRGESDPGEAEKTPPNGSEEEAKKPEGGNMTMADAMKVIDNIMPIIDKILNFAKNGGTDMHDPEAEKMAGAFDNSNCNEVETMDTATELQMLKDRLAALEATKATALDSKAVVAEVDERNKLVQQLIAHGYQIAADGLTLAETAKIAAEKIGIACDDATALVAVRAYMHNRAPAKSSQEVYTLAQDKADVGQTNPASNDLFNI